MEQTEEKMDKTEEEMENEFDLIDKMFPGAKFVIAIDIEELDDVVTERTNIVIKNTYDCYCYAGVNKSQIIFTLAANILRISL